MKKRIAILGSTGSIGTQTLDIIRKNREEYQAVVLSCSSRIAELEQQIQEFSPELVVVASEQDGLDLQHKYPRLQVAFGAEGLITAAQWDCHMVVNALMGIRGLVPTYYAILAGTSIAFANKETLVAGGQLIMGLAKERGVKLLPVDSEHSAIFQCLQGNQQRDVRKLILTASGGPFRGYSLEQLGQVTREQALKHPKWVMGSKITIDSATLMNKGLEIIEARWLFDVPAEQIDVVVHPQSIVHSMVEYCDGSVLAQLGLPDMRVPISCALAWPNRLPNDSPSLNFFEEGKSLTFEKPDPKTFRCLALAKEALTVGGSSTVVLNGANEALVELFLDGQIQFIEIQRYMETILNLHAPVFELGLEEILELDRQVRCQVLELVKKG